MSAIKVEKLPDAPHRRFFITKIDGMTVREAIRALSIFPAETKVFTYTQDGEFSPVIRIMRDSNKVAIF